jgi:glycosyltransferase involved in cell wall biosynthesis
MGSNKVTVLIAHQNYQKYLPGCIQSILKSTIKASICLIDDGSDDRASVEEIAKTLIGEGEHFYVDEKQEVIKGNGHTVIYLEGKNGPSFARNRGIEATLNETDYYLVVDADDEIYPNKIGTMLSLITKDTGIAAVYANYRIHNVETGIEHIEYKEPYSRQRLLEECIVHSGSMISKQALLDVREETGFFDEEMRTCEDYDLWIRFSETKILAHIPEVLTMVRVHNQNSTSTVKSDIWNKNWQRIREKTAKRHNET